MAKPQAEFVSILDRQVNDTDLTIKNLPPGSYVATVQGYKLDKSSKKQTEFVEFTMKIVEAQNDVDEDALDEYLTNADGSRKKLTDCTIRSPYYLTENALPRLRIFLDHLEGNKPGDKESKAFRISYSQAIAESINKTCVIFVKHKPWQSGEGVSARVSGSAIAE